MVHTIIYQDSSKSRDETSRTMITFARRTTHHARRREIFVRIRICGRSPPGLGGAGAGPGRRVAEAGRELL